MPHLSVENTIAQFKAKAYHNLGIEEREWQPQLGFKANRPILEKLYPYYQSLYFQNPEAFLWMGLARLTGGQVLFGMGNLVKIAKDPCVLTQEIVAVAKDIFDNLAWQHELYLVDSKLLVETCRELDKKHNHKHLYESCWKNILKNAPLSIDAGNRMLLENEQQNTIQHHYDTIKADAYSQRYFWFTRFVMRNIHPHHRRFILDMPFGDITQFKDRWQWISHEQGMWQTWIALPQEERNRLVALSNENVMRHNW